jgi:hypothetical protein
MSINTLLFLSKKNATNYFDNFIGRDDPWTLQAPEDRFKRGEIGSASIFSARTNIPTDGL